MCSEAPRISIPIDLSRTSRNQKGWVEAQPIDGSRFALPIYAGYSVSNRIGGDSNVGFAEIVSFEEQGCIKVAGQGCKHSNRQNSARQDAVPCQSGCMLRAQADIAPHLS